MAGQSCRLAANRTAGATGLRLARLTPALVLTAILLCGCVKLPDEPRWPDLELPGSNPIVFTLPEGGSDSRQYVLSNANGDALLEISDIVSTHAAWFGATPQALDIPAGQTGTITIAASAAGQAGETADGCLAILSNDFDGPDTVRVRVEISGTAGAIEVEPDHFEVDVAPGGVWSDSLTVRNVGGSDLEVHSITDGAVWLAEEPTGPFTIPPSGTRWVGVEVDAGQLVAGSYQDTIRIVSDDAQMPEYLVPVHVEVGGEPDLRVSPDSLEVTVSPGDSWQGTLLVANDGTVDLEVDSLVIDVAWLAVSPGAFTVSPAESQAVQVEVDASGLGDGDHYATMVVYSNDPDAPAYQVPVHVRVAVEPDIWVDPAALQFTVPAGETAEDTLFVYNRGTADLVVSGVSDIAAWMSTTHSGGFTVPAADPDQWVQAVVTVDAGALREGDYSAVITISSNDPDTPEYIVPVTLAVVEAHIAVSRDTLRFVVATGGASQDTLTIGNSGGAVLVAALTDDDADRPGWLSESPESLTVAPGGAEAVTIDADASGLAGGTTYEAIITIHSNDLDTPEYEVAVSMEVTGQPDIEVEPSELDLTVEPYGSWEGTVEIRNVGTVVLAVDSIVDGSEWLEEDPTSIPSIGVGGSAQVTVTIDASGLTPNQTYEDTVRIYSTDPDENPYELPVTVRIDVASDISVLPESFDLTLSSGSAADTSLTVDNVGTAELVVDSLSAGSTWLVVDTGGFSIPVAGFARSVPVTVDAGQLTPGSYADTIRIYSNDPVEPVFPVPVALEVVAVADIWVSPTSLEFTVSAGQSDTQLLTVGNDASATADLVVSDISDDAGWLSEDPTSIAAIAPGASEQVSVTADASGLGVGDYSATVTIVSNDPDESPYQVPVTLHVVAPDITVSPTVLDFSVGPGSSQTQYLTVGNDPSATADLVVSSITDDQGWLSEDPTSFAAIAPGSSEQVSVTADASGLGVGDYSATITILSNDPDENPYLVSVTLHVTAPDIWVSPTSLEFTVAVGGSDTKYLTVGNESFATADLVVYSIASVEGWLTENPTGFATIAPGGSEQVSVTADAAGLGVGDHFSTITILSNDPDESPYQIPVTLHVTAPDIWVSPTSLEFTVAVGGSDTKYLTVGNESFATADLVVYSIGDNAGWLSENPASFAAIAPGASEQVTVTANASGLGVGDHFATITILSNDPDESPYSVPVTLHVVAPDIWVSPTSLEFTLASGGSDTETLTIGNESFATADLVVYSIDDDAGDPPVIPDWLSEDPTGFAAIAPGASEQVSVTADATGLDPGSVHYATISIVSNDPDENPYQVSVVLNVEP
jgi:uncharacterized membrane protein